jgi:hypothetical protein
MFEQNAFGSVWFLSNFPDWLVFLDIVFLSTGMVLLLRWWWEDKIYDKARSSTPGDLFLAGYCANMAAYLQIVGLPKTSCFTGPAWHWTVLVGMITIAISLHVGAIARGGAERRWTMLPAQWYHNLVVVPLLAYLIVSTLPILWYGDSAQLWTGAVICFGTWTGLVVWDIKHDNMVQVK